MGFPQAAADGTELVLEFFQPAEFDHPELMDPDFLLDLDEFRRRLDFPLRITDDARTAVDMARIYGASKATWPDSAHLARPGKYLVRAVDLKPAGNLTFEQRESRELAIVWLAITFHNDGTWPDLGLELATAHIHIDDYRRPGRKARRPTIFPGVSR